VDQNTKDMIWTLLKISAVGTVVGIPVGLWAMKRWNQPGEEWKTAVLLTALGFGVKEVMLRSSEVRAEEGVARAEAEVSGWRAPRRGVGDYMPAPGMPNAPSVYYPGLKQRANGRAAIQSGLNPTAL